MLVKFIPGAAIGKSAEMQPFRQGQTADRVLIHLDSYLAAKDLLTNRMAYVSVSRGQWDAQIVTNHRGVLVNALGRDVSHQSAYQPQQAIAHWLVGTFPRLKSASSVQA